MGLQGRISKAWDERSQQISAADIDARRHSDHGNARPGNGAMAARYGVTWGRDTGQVDLVTV